MLSLYIKKPPEMTRRNNTVNEVALGFASQLQSEDWQSRHASEDTLYGMVQWALDKKACKGHTAMVRSWPKELQDARA